MARTRLLQFGTIGFRPTYSEGGQTLVDLIVALALLSAAVAGAGWLSTTTAQVNAEAGRRSQATALASRELEGLRAMRDTAELSGGWATSVLAQNGCHTYVMHLNQVTRLWTAVPAATPQPYTAASSGGSSLPQSNFNADYSRFSRLTKLCSANDYQQPGSPPAGNVTASSSSSVLTVTEVVQWTEAHGPTRQVTMNTMLTDFKQ